MVKARQTKVTYVELAGIEFQVFVSKFSGKANSPELGKFSTPYYNAQIAKISDFLHIKKALDLYIFSDSSMNSRQRYFYF